MLVFEDGASFGVISGGCLEEDVSKRAAEVIRTGKPILVAYDTKVHLGCNGIVEIFIEAIIPECAESFFLHAEDCVLRRRQSIAALTFFESRGRIPHRLASYPLLSEDDRLLTSEPLSAQMLHDARGVFNSARPLLREYQCENGAATALLHVIHPPIHLWIFGAGPDVAPLASFAAQLGWRVTAVNHPAQTPAILPPGCASRALAPEQITELQADARTAAIVMTHHYGRDLAYLANLFPSTLPYLGLLGPRHRREQLLASLMDAGVTLSEEQLEAFHSPAGLDLGAEGPEEIALSIIGEIKAVMSGRAGGSLKSRKTAIHSSDAPKIVPRAA